MRTLSTALSLTILAAAASVSVAMVPKTTTAEPKPEPEAPPVPEPEVTARKTSNPISSRMTIAEAMANTGTSTPKQALKALNERGGKRYVYMPHVGAKERAKGLKQLEKERARLAAKDAAK